MRSGPGALRCTRAEVLARDETGNPIFTRAALGQGQVFFLTTPVERLIASVPGAYTSASPYGQTWRVYAQVFAGAWAQHVWQKTTPEVCVTEHPESDRTRVLVLINHRTEPVVEPLKLAAGWRLNTILHGTASGENGIALPAADGAILRVERV